MSILRILSGLRSARIVGFALSLSVTWSCTQIPPPDIQPATDPDAAWAAVLATFVDDRGRVDFQGLAERPESLSATVAHIYAAGPRTTPARYPDRDARIAFYINAYNALAMFNVIESGIPDDLFGLNKVEFFVLRRLAVDGDEISLYALENDVIRPLGEERIHFALNCMVVGCPRLPREPFSGDRLDHQLDREAAHFFSEARNVTVDHDRRTVYLSEILDFYTEDFLAVAPSLIAYVNRYRDEPIPEDYDVAFFDYDWTINAQPSSD